MGTAHGGLAGRGVQAGPAAGTGTVYTDLAGVVLRDGQAALGGRWRAEGDGITVLEDGRTGLIDTHMRLMCVLSLLSCFPSPSPSPPLLSSLPLPLCTAEWA